MRMHGVLSQQVDKNLSSENSKALYLVFSTVDKNQYRLTSMCKSAKNAWDILKTRGIYYMALGWIY